MIRAKDKEAGASQVLGELDFFACKSKGLPNIPEDGIGRNEPQTESKEPLGLHSEDEANEYKGTVKKRKRDGHSVPGKKKKKTEGKSKRYKRRYMDVIRLNN